MINDLKDLKALFKLCRAQGITDFKMNGIDIKFGDLPQGQIPYQEPSVDDPVNRYAGFPQGELTASQLAFYSAGGRPDDDPEIEKAI
jgi:hypothetical protein